MKFEFGMVVTADFLPETRMMILYPAEKAGGLGHRLNGSGPKKWWRTDRENWWAIVLRDAAPAAGEPSDHYWQAGEMVTLSPDNAGLRIVDTSEGTTE